MPGASRTRRAQSALAEKNIPYAGIEKFQDADVDVVPQLTRLKDAGADVLFLVANVAPSSQVVKSLDRMGWNVPIVSHWGPAGGRFQRARRPEQSAGALHPDVQLLGQDVAERRDVLAALQEEISEIKSLADVTPAVGIANAYDAMHLTRSRSPRPARRRTESSPGASIPSTSTTG
jgi:branched-chain amino acid transport system substrate-binding protein